MGREELSSRIHHIMKLLLVIAAAAVAQASGDWTGSGRLQCYGHLYTDVTTPPVEDTSNMARCNATPWSGPPLSRTWDLRQCSLPPTTDLNSKSGLGITMHPTFRAQSV